MIEERELEQFQDLGGDAKRIMSFLPCLGVILPPLGLELLQPLSPGSKKSFFVYFLLRSLGDDLLS